MTTLISKTSLIRGALLTEESLYLCQHGVAPVFDVKSVENPARPQRAPHLHQYHLSNCMFIDTDSSAQICTRNKVWMRRHDDADHLMLQLFTYGKNDVVNGVRSRAEDGQTFDAVNLVRPLEARSTYSRIVMMVLPRDFLKEAVPQLDRTPGAIFAPGSSGARIFGEHMLSLAEHLGKATTAHVPAIVSGTLRLLGTRSQRAESYAGTAVAAAFRFACRLIECYIRAPGLNAESICRHMRCSRPRRYRMFNPLGGVREYIQRRRLVACFDTRASCAHRHRQAFDIALEFGFISPSHFSHLLCEYFGMTPRDSGLQDSQYFHKKTGARQSGSGGNDEAEKMWQRTKTLAESAKRSPRAIAHRLQLRHSRGSLGDEILTPQEFLLACCQRFRSLAWPGRSVHAIGLLERRVHEHQAVFLCGFGAIRTWLICLKRTVVDSAIRELSHRKGYRLRRRLRRFRSHFQQGLRPPARTVKKVSLEVLTEVLNPFVIFIDRAFLKESKG